MSDIASSNWTRISLEVLLIMQQMADVFDGPQCPLTKPSSVSFSKRCAYYGVKKVL